MEIKPTFPPINATLADRSVKVCNKEGIVNLNIVTIAGRVHLRAVPCLNMEGERDELLLGTDALKSLGIDIDQSLDQPVDLALLNDGGDVYPVGDELPPPLPPPASTMTSTELRNRAVQNALPQEHV